MGNCEATTVTVESEVFTGGCYPAQVIVDLDPNVVHHLEVTALVREVTSADGCVYGGYTLTTRRDRDGSFLIIEQGQPPAPALPDAIIGPANAARLQPSLSLAPEARLTVDFAFYGNEELVSVGYAEWISRWDLTTGQEQGRIGSDPQTASALCVATSPDHSRIATGGTAESPGVRIWDANSGEMRELGSHDSYPVKVAFSPSGSRLASGGNDNTVQVWDLMGGSRLGLLEGDIPRRRQSFHSLYWFDDDTLVAAGSDVIYWWDVITGQVLERLQRPEQAAFLVEAAVRWDGGFLTAVAQDDAIYVRERRGREWKVWAGPAGVRLTHVEFSPDGSLLGATTDEGELLLWEVSTAELLAKHSVSNGSIAALRFSPDGKVIAVGGWDSPIWLWGSP
jgi:WD40 repeat protein